MKFFRSVLSIFFIGLISSCVTGRHLNDEAYKSLPNEDKRLADTLIKYVLDNEGLYTVAGKLKPISSVKEIRIVVDSGDTSKYNLGAIADFNPLGLSELKHYQRVVNTLNFGDLKFVIIPFKTVYEKVRTLGMYVYRQSLIDSLLREQQDFFAQFGFVPGASPDALINTIEYESKFKRFKGYGYLFGYPDHAVDFYTDAAISEDKTKEFVKRDPFQIPVFSRPTGRFVYVVPKGYKPTNIDSAILLRANYTLDHYKELRATAHNQNGPVNYYKLLTGLIAETETRKNK